jgi:hypothetical protein
MQRPSLSLPLIIAFMLSTFASIDCHALGSSSYLACLISRFSRSLNSSTEQVARKKKGVQSRAALNSLKDFIKSQRTHLPHSLTMTPQGGIVQIGLLDRSQKLFMVLLLRAIREGNIAEINTGPVIGPKVFIILNHFLSEAKNLNSPLVIKGTFEPKAIIQKAQKEQMSGLLERASPYAGEWSKKEASEFDEAIKSLRLETCNQKFIDPNKRLCAFEFVIKNGKLSVSLTPY